MVEVHAYSFLGGLVCAFPFAFLVVVILVQRAR